MPQEAAAVTADGALPAVPSSSLHPSPLPLGNAAIWQEALNLDNTIDVGKNYLSERFYQVVAYAQTLENSSNSYVLGDPMTSSELTSQGLQSLSMYPTQFNQPQADHQTTTKGRW